MRMDVQHADFHALAWNAVDWLSVATHTCIGEDALLKIRNRECRRLPYRLQILNDNRFAGGFGTGRRCTQIERDCALPRLISQPVRDAESRENQYDEHRKADVDWHHGIAFGGRP